MAGGGAKTPVAARVRLGGQTVFQSFPKMTSSGNGISMRTIVDLPDPERAQLDALCRQRGLSRAEGVRQALRFWLAQQQPSHSTVFGLWRDRPQDGVQLQQVLREEWSER